MRTPWICSVPVLILALVIIGLSGCSGGRSGRPPVHKLVLQIDGSGTLSPPAGEYPYLSGTTEELSAEPAEGWEFFGWVGPVPEPHHWQTTILMEADHTVTAVFIHEDARLPVERVEATNGRLDVFFVDALPVAPSVHTFAAQLDDGTPLSLTERDWDPAEAHVVSLHFPQFDTQPDPITYHIGVGYLGGDFIASEVPLTIPGEGDFDRLEVLETIRGTDVLLGDRVTGRIMVKNRNQAASLYLPANVVWCPVQKTQTLPFEASDSRLYTQGENIVITFERDNPLWDLRVASARGELVMSLLDQTDRVIDTIVVSVDYD